MNPKTTLHIVIHFTCALAIFCSMLGVFALQGQNVAYREVSKLQQKHIIELRAEVIKLQTLDGVVRVFDMVLPESYRAELTQIDYRLRYME